MASPSVIPVAVTGYHRSRISRTARCNLNMVSKLFVLG